MLAYHYYCWVIDPKSIDQPYKRWQRVICDDVVGPLVITMAFISIVFSVVIVFSHQWFGLALRTSVLLRRKKSVFPVAVRI